MKIRVDRGVFSEALNEAFSVAGVKSPKEILRYVKLTATEEGVVLEATDDEMSLVLSMDAEVLSPGECMVSDRVRSVCREQVGESVELESTGNGIRLSAVSGSWELATPAPAVFPASLFVAGGESIHLPLSAIQKGLRRVRSATDPQSSRYALGGVCFEVDDGSLAVVATDGRRLAMHIIEEIQGVWKESRVVPLKTVNVIIGMSGDHVEVAQNNQVIQFSGDRWKLISRLVEGKFPRWRDVIPKQQVFSMETISGPFMGAIRQAMIVSVEESRGVDFCFTPGELQLHGVGADVGTSRVQLPVVCDIALHVSLDPHLLLDFLKNIDAAETVRFHSPGKSDSPVRLDADGTLCVVMPLVKD